MPIDPSVLLSGQQMRLADPLAMAQQMMTLGQLADAKQVRQQQMAKAKSDDEAAAALQAALPALLRGESLESLVANNPTAGPALLKVDAEIRKNKLEDEKARAAAGKDKAESQLKLAERFGNEAEFLATHPNLTPDMIANFQKKVAANGLEGVLTNVPFQDWASPEKARQALQGTAAMFYNIKDRAENAEKNRHNVTTEGIQRDTLNNTIRHQGVMEGQGRERLGIERGTQAALMQGEPKEIMVDGKPVLAVYDKKSGTFFDANTRQPIKQGMGPKVDAPKAAPEAYSKQVSGITNLNTAIDNYLAKLKNFGITDLASPDARADMGTAYNNMMLQAKEAYNLGVLNGPDYQILTDTITDPVSFKGGITSNSAMAAQAEQLRTVMQRNAANLANVYKQPTPDVAKGGSAQGGPRQIKDAAEYNALPSGAEYVDPNGVRRKKP